jgi:hypothetical protein
MAGCVPTTRRWTSSGPLSLNGLVARTVYEEATRDAPEPLTAYAARALEDLGASRTRSCWRGP